MEMKVQIPFQQLLTLIKTLSPTQKARLREELIDGTTDKKGKDEFLEFLLNGPVYSKNEIAVIKENRKSIAAWRTKN